MKQDKNVLNNVIDQTTLDAIYLSKSYQIQAMDCSWCVKFGFDKIKKSKQMKNDYFKLKKDMEIFTTPDFPSIKPIDYEKIKEKLYRRYILNFITVINENFDKEDLPFLYNNINSLAVEKYNSKTKPRKNKNVIASYTPDENKITINPKYEESMYHELFHMASSRETEKCSYCGFAQIDNKEYSCICIGLNEGYTQLLTERYFDQKRDKSASYPIERIIAEKIEEIIGKDKMEKLYFKTNLEGLINEIKKYGDDEDVITVLNGVEYIYKYQDAKTFKSIKNEYMENVYNDLIKTLIKLNNNKLENLYNSGILSKDDIVFKSLEYKSSLEEILKVNNKYQEAKLYPNIEIISNNSERGKIR